MEQIGTVKKTKEKCPVTGVWEIVHPDKRSFYIKGGEIFPEYDGQEVSWILIQEILKDS